MATKKDETASFVLRFTQKIFQNEEGEPQIQWRGNMRHVQTGDEKNFSKFDEVVTFIQSSLTDLTVQATEHKSPEEQKGHAVREITHAGAAVFLFDREAEQPQRTELGPQMAWKNIAAIDLRCKGRNLAGAEALHGVTQHVDRFAEAKVEFR